MCSAASNTTSRPTRIIAIPRLFFVVVASQDSKPWAPGPTSLALRDSLGAGFAAVVFVDPPPLAPAKASAALMASQEAAKFTHLSVANLPNLGRAYRAIADIATREVSWLALVDSDEYMYGNGNGGGSGASGGNGSSFVSLGAALKRLSTLRPEAGQVSVPWEVFGSGGHYGRMPKCVVGAFTFRRPWDVSRPEPTKSILRLDALRPGIDPSVHRSPPADLCPGWASLRADGTELTRPPPGPSGAIKDFYAPSPQRAIFRVNHYW